MPDIGFQAARLKECIHPWYMTDMVNVIVTAMLKMQSHRLQREGQLLTRLSRMPIVEEVSNLIHPAAKAFIFLLVQATECNCQGVRFPPVVNGPLNGSSALGSDIDHTRPHL